MIDWTHQLAVTRQARLLALSHASVNYVPRPVPATDPTSRESDIVRQLADFHVTVPRIPISAVGLAFAEARNQMPTTLLLRNGVPYRPPARRAILRCFARMGDTKVKKR